MLREFRLRAGITQEELAESSGVSARTISLLETGKRGAPRLVSVRLLAQALTLAPHERDVLLAACRQRCGSLVDNGTVELVTGDAAHTGQPDASVDVVFTVNNVMLWPDWDAGFAELHRVLRPDGRILVSAHEKWLPGGLQALTAAVT
ncbi:helix-turn-helix domain-containing protein, partial [Kibdelosporangium lantanae]